jgi:putative transposase
VRNARYRGTIERYFRTQNQRYMDLFTGRTFGNPIERGAYDSEAHASMNFEEFARCLVRLIVDAYHNTPHEGLNNMTPLDAWTTMTAKYEVRPLGTAHERIFDVNIYNQHIGRNGVKFLGIPYFDKKLQKIYMNYKDQKVDIRVNRWDLGKIRISTADKDGYFDLKTPIPGFDNVSVTHWRVAQRWMNKRFSHEQQKDLATVRRAIKATEHDAEVAEEKNNVTSHLTTEADFLKFNREFKSDLFQPKAGQDWGDYVPPEFDAPPEELPPVATAPRSPSGILGPTATGPLDPDRFNKARREAGMRSPSPLRTPRQPTSGSVADPNVRQETTSKPASEKKPAKRAPLFNPDWKSDEK